jgi:hypothetical protein
MQEQDKEQPYGILTHQLKCCWTWGTIGRDLLSAIGHSPCVLSEQLLLPSSGCTWHQLLMFPVAAGVGHMAAVIPWKSLYGLWLARALASTNPTGS